LPIDSIELNFIIMTSSPDQTAKMNIPDGSQEQDLDVFVNDLLHQMTSRFEHMGKSIITRIDDMAERIDSLEQNITDLLDDQGVERFDNENHTHSHHTRSQSKHKTRRVERYDNESHSPSRSKHKTNKRHIHMNPDE